MDFTLPAAIPDLLAEIDTFIDAELRPIEAANPQFFDHRKDFARTDPETGLPSREWAAILRLMRAKSDEAGTYRMTLPQRYGGRDIDCLTLSSIQQHLARRGPGLHNDLTNTASSVVGIFPIVELLLAAGTVEQQDTWIPPLISGELSCAFGLTESDHGSDATRMQTTAVREHDGWRINGGKRFITGINDSSHCLVFARTAGESGTSVGIGAFIVPMSAEGVQITGYDWMFTAPTETGAFTLDNVHIDDDCVLGDPERGLVIGLRFLQRGRIRQSATSVGCAQFCVAESVKYAKGRETAGRPIAEHQAIQWPLVDLHTEAEMLETLVRKTAWLYDQGERVSDLVAMTNYRANRLVCAAADQAMQTHGARGYTRHYPFEHLYRFYRRYRITEGTDEVQMRRAAQVLFGVAKP